MQISETNQMGTLINDIVKARGDSKTAVKPLLAITQDSVFYNQMSKCSILSESDVNNHCVLNLFITYRHKILNIIQKIDKTFI